MFLKHLTNAFSWGIEKYKKLEELKDLLCDMVKNPNTMRPNPELPLIVETDARKCAVRTF